MIIILGGSAAGKTTLLNMFTMEHPQYHKVITYTTRPKRKGEIDGLNYHFVTPSLFDSLIKRNFFAEYSKYRDWYYGIAKEDCKIENAIAVLTPKGLRTLKRLNYNVTSVYIDVDRRSRLINILERGDDIDEAYRRNLSDVGQFDGINNEADFVIKNDNYRMNEEQVLQEFEKIIGDFYE